MPAARPDEDGGMLWLDVSVGTGGRAELPAP